MIKCGLCEATVKDETIAEILQWAPYHYAVQGNESVEYGQLCPQCAAMYCDVVDTELVLNANGIDKLKQIQNLPENKQ